MVAVAWTGDERTVGRFVLFFLYPSSLGVAAWPLLSFDGVWQVDFPMENWSGDGAAGGRLVVWIEVGDAQLFATRGEQAKQGRATGENSQKLGRGRAAAIRQSGARSGA